jgi:hypothetical protein
MVDTVAMPEPYEREGDPSAENEDDFALGQEAVERAVVTGTDWTVGTILDQLRRGNIQLNPRFQRRDAWRPERKSQFIESLFLGLPVPQIVLAELPDRPGKFLVIDGKQRLLTLRQFAATEEDTFNPLELSHLKLRPDLNGTTLAQLSEAAGHEDDLAAFENQTIRTVVVRAWPDEAFLYRVFYRLNSGSVPLSPQELRQALHPGPFLDFAFERSEESEPIQRVLGIDAPDFRMRDVELLIRFFAFADFLPDYGGNLKAFLDLTAERLNAEWGTRETEIVEQADQCDRAITATYEVFEEHAFRRWAGSWQRPFNRAVFDVMTFYFRDPQVARAAINRRAEVVEAFRHASEEDEHFDEALQSTTKTITNTCRRLEAWGRRLESVLGVALPVPALEGDRIVIP